MKMPAFEISIRSVARVFLELLVVFVGVYAAFALNTYREAQRNNTLKAAYCRTLINEMTYLAYVADQQSQYLDSIHVHYRDAVESGRMPALKPHFIEFDARAMTIEAAATIGSLEAIGIDLTVKLTLGNNLIVAIQHRYRRYQELTRDILLTHLNAERREFYTADRRLREKYQWYLAFPKALSQMLATLRDTIRRQAIPEIEATIAQLTDAQG